MNAIHLCKSCGHEGQGKFCNACGQQYNIKRITISALLHDVFHFFTHLEKGFWYTLRELAVRPGIMQRQYLEGTRSRHQKPFSMFFICVSVNALVRYWLENALIKYFGKDSGVEANLYHEYFVLLFVALVPVMILCHWLVFIDKKYNYAETGVFILYNLSFVLLAVIPISILRLIWHSLDTVWIELPLLSIYMLIAVTNFYRGTPGKRWLIVLKSLIVIAAMFSITQIGEDLVKEFLNGKQ